MDEGADGVCSTCSEERAVRAQTSAVQREWEVAQQVPRCNYCRAAADDETPLDEEGYCEACRVLPRCTDHADLIAVGHCKSCRQEFCRKCLGFTDVCQACAAKQKAKPAAKPGTKSGAKPAGAGSSAKAGASGAKPGGARPKKKRPPGAAEAEPKGARPKGKGGKPAVELDEKGRPKKKPPTRGQTAVAEKMKAKSAGRSKLFIIMSSVAGALCVLVLLSGMWLKANSPEAESVRLQEQMIQVHRAVIHYQNKTHRLPGSADDIRAALAELRLKGANRIRVVMAGAGSSPSSVVFEPKGESFFIRAADGKGQELRNASGGVVEINQYFDSSASP